MANSSSAGSPFGPADGVMKGETVGLTRIFNGVDGGSLVANSGASAASTPAVIGSVAPPNGMEVTSWFKMPHSVIEPSSWLKAEAEMVRPRP